MTSGKTILAHTLIYVFFYVDENQLIESSHRSRQSSDLIDSKLLWTEFRSESHGTLTPWISDYNDYDEDIVDVVIDDDDSNYHYYYYRHSACLDTVKMALYPPINCNCKSYSPSTFKTIASISLSLSPLGTRHQLVVIVIVQCSVSKQILIINILWLSTLGTRRPPEEQTDTSTSQTDFTLVASR